MRYLVLCAAWFLLACGDDSGGSSEGSLEQPQCVVLNEETVKEFTSWPVFDCVDTFEDGCDWCYASFVYVYGAVERWRFPGIPCGEFPACNRTDQVGPTEW